MNKLFLLDSNSLINKAFYALPSMTDGNGRMTNGVYGFVNMLLKIIREHAPTHIVAAFDVKAPTFRKLMYGEYKAQRKGMPDELAEQLPILKELLRLMRVAIVEKEGYEADDIIGTLSKKSEMPVFIVTGDKDSLQLIDGNTTVFLTRKGISEIDICTPETLSAEGLTPPQIIELKSLMGDASDNIPGVPGVGNKTARKLLADYGTLDGVYANIDNIKGALKDKLIAGKDSAYISRTLATIDVNVPIQEDINESKISGKYSDKLRDFLISLNMKSVVNKLEFASEIDNHEEITELESLLCATSSVIDLSENTEELNNILTGCDKFSLYCGTDVHIGVGNIDYTLSKEKFSAAVPAIAEAVSAGAEISVYDSKLLYRQLGKIDGIKYDVALMAYLLNPNATYKSINEIADEYKLRGTETQLISGLSASLTKKLGEQGMSELYEKVELPLAFILYDMERVGFQLDKAELDKQGAAIAAELETLIAAINGIAGMPININSPKQLGELLFVRLGLRKGKKTKTGYSTSVEVLDALKGEHEVIDLILRYRTLSKLLSTYINGLSCQTDEEGRVHTIFKQTVTATGRLSSIEPNLQNIPVRKPEGRALRKLFIPSKGNVLIAADYSQIELRIMADLSGDPALIKAFKDGVDIHTATAAAINKVSLSEVTSAMRSAAKAVNFGIIYGISDFGLARDSGITQYEAKIFIANYFSSYPNVKRYLDSAVQAAAASGYATTVLGRRRPIPELRSSNKTTRNFGERVAMNSPLQGSASDIIKLAMIDVWNALQSGGYKAKLILQVHDELIIDAPKNEAEKVEKLLKELMENAYALSVPLKVDVGIGNNWLEAK